MRWNRGAPGGNVQDRRSRPGGRAALPVGGGLIGVIATVLILVLGGGGGYDVGSPFEQFPSQPQAAGDGSAMQNAPDAERELVDFVSFVIGDLQKFWADDFRKADRAFEAMQLVLFRQATDTGCGPGSAQTGRSTARATARSTSTSGSSASWPSASTRRATSPRPTSWRTSTATTCRRSRPSRGRS